MNDTLDHVVKKFDLDLNTKSPIPIYKINRTIMAQTLNELNLKVGAEIGVAKGDHAKILCDNIPDLKLYCIDVWEDYPGYNEYIGRITRYYEKAKVLLSPYNCIFIEKFSMDAVKDFEDGSLDYVYIDGAHDFKNVAMDVCEWTPKVRTGGIVYGHDFKRSYRHVNPNDPTRWRAEDDDSGIGRNARIALTLEPGEYVAQVRHYASGTGAYGVRLRTSS